MSASSRALARGSLTMLGTIIGAGVFAIPYAMKTMGVFAGSIVYAVIAFVVLATHLLYADIILQDSSLRRMRLPGQARDILGAWPGHLALLAYPLQSIGACLAYLILGGEFLAQLASALGLPDTLFTWQLLFWFGGAVVVFFGLRFVARVEAFMTWALIGLLILSVFLFLPRAEFSLFRESHWQNAVAPLGALIFALSAFNVVPEVVDICNRNRRRTLLAIAVGSCGAAILSWLFGVFGYVAFGDSLSRSPSMLARAFPASFFWLLPTLGFFAVATSFITITQDLKAMIHFELRVSKFLAWLVALGAPFLLLVITRRNFLTTVDFVGSIFGAINGMLIASMAFRRFTRARGIAIICAVVFAFTFLWRIFSTEGLF